MVMTKVVPDLIDPRTREGLSFYGFVREACAQGILTEIDEADLQLICQTWRQLARSEQLPPAGDWSTWLIMAGRGFGKTRAGAEWVRSIAERDGSARMALVGASLHDARSIM